MTKTQFREILEELKTARSTNKFRTGRMFYTGGYDEPDKEIDKINTEELYIRFEGREYLTHDHMINVPPWALRARFLVSVNPLDVNTITFKRN